MSDNQRKYLNNIKKNKYLILIIQLAIIILFLLIWEYLSIKEIINTFVFSSPSNIINTIVNLYKTNNLFPHIIATILETFIAFSLGIGLSLLIAIILYINKFLAKIIDPFLTLINSLPKVALGPIIIIWCGANTKSIIVMALLINLIISIITIYSGFKETDQNKIKLLKIFGASKCQILSKCVIPANIPTIISALKINISMSLIGVVMGEFLVSKAGIGYLILYGSQVFNLDLVMTGIALLLILSIILYKSIGLIEKCLIKNL